MAMRTTILTTALLVALFPQLALGDATSDCVQSCSSRYGVNDGRLSGCTSACFQETEQQGEYQRQLQQQEYERQQSEEQYRQEDMRLREQELELERQRREQDRQNYQRMLDLLSQPKPCPSNSRGMTAAEKARNPGASCICFEGFVPDMATNTCMEKPAPQSQAQPSSDCPLHSKRSTDGKTCDCDVDYEPDPKNTYCVRIRKMEMQSSTPAPKHTRVPSDVPSNAWYRDALASFVEDEDVSADEEFKPAERATRGDFIQLLVRSMDIPRSFLFEAKLTQAVFDDVPAQYQETYETAALKGWVKGERDCYGQHPCYGRPERPINRAEAAALIIRAHNLRNGNEAPWFIDASPGEWYTDSIRTAGSRCILRGDPGTGTVRPADTLNRAEMVVMIARASKGLSYPLCEE